MTKLLESLAGSIGEFLNRAFITVGLAPSLILVVGLGAYANGVPTMRDALQSVSAGGEDLVEVVGASAILVLVIAWALVSLQSALQLLLSDPPVRPLRNILLNHEISRLESDVRARGQQEKRLGALLWQPSGERFVKVIGEGKEKRDESEFVVRQSQRARTLLGGRRPLTVDLAGAIADTIVPLWHSSIVASGEPPAEVMMELEKWREWTKTERNARRLDRATKLVKTRIERVHADTTVRPKDAQWMRPTRFGNRLAAIDDYAHERYAMDTSTLWTRLWGVLEEDVKSEFRHAQQRVAAMVNTSFVLLVLAFAIAFVPVDGSRFDPPVAWWRAPAWAAASVLLACVAYSAAVQAIGAMGEVMCRSIDLHRLDLLRALGCETPRTVEEEQGLFRELQGFFVHGTPRAPLRSIRSAGS